MINSPLLRQAFPCSKPGNGLERPNILFLLLVSFFGLLCLVPQVEALPSQQPPKRNIIFMVSDGMGPASLSLTRSFRQFTEGLEFGDVLSLDKHLIGASRTRSNDSLVTDSAAGATAFSCALKSYNGAIGVDPEKNPCGTILEAMKLQGYLTGLVVTTRITDATPASFSAHVDYRYQEDLIAEYQLGNYSLGRTVDLMIGGGRCHYLPKEKGGCRNDNKDLIEIAKSQGWSYAGDRAAFDQLDYGFNVSLPLISLLTNYDIPYDLDRNPNEFPSLEEEAIVALNALSKATENSDKGFFLLIEGSRIDHAGHSNDPAAQVREVLAYDKAFQAAIDFADSTDVETIIISTSDHETGGLSTARQVSPSYPDYLWYPEVLFNASHSGEFIAKKLRSLNIHDEAVLKKYIKHEILEKDLGILDSTEDEIAKLSKNFHNSEYITNELISRRSQTGWSTHGHSAVDVNIYAYSNKESSKLALLKDLGGNHENTEIGKFMADFLSLNLTHVTELISKDVHSPTHYMEEHLDKVIDHNDVNQIYLAADH